jgi:hypothetical protein
MLHDARAAILRRFGERIGAGRVHSPRPATQVSPGLFDPAIAGAARHRAADTSADQRGDDSST